MLEEYAAREWPRIEPESRSPAVEALVRLTAGHIVQPAGLPAKSARRIAAIGVRVAGAPGR